MFLLSFALTKKRAGRGRGGGGRMSVNSLRQIGPAIRSWLTNAR